MNSKDIKFKCFSKNCLDTEALNLRVNMNYIEGIYTVKHLDIPDNIIDKFDVSVRKNGNIMMWYLDSDNNNMYEMYIGSLKEIDVLSLANTFKLYPNIQILDLTLFDFTEMEEIPEDLFGSCNVVIDKTYCSNKLLSKVIVKNEENKELVREMLKNSGKSTVKVLVSAEVIYEKDNNFN